MVSKSAPTAGAARDERHDDGAGSGGQCSIALVRRLTAWLAGAAGGAAAFRLLRRRRGGAPTAPPPEPAAGADPRAEELRAKLDETRREPAGEAEPQVESPSDVSPEERRRRVHEQGRAALDEMQPG